jgi:hypothetical protein
VLEMKTTNRRIPAKIVIVALILNIPRFAVASPVSRRDTARSDSTVVSNSVVAATSKIGLPTGPAGSLPAENTRCATLQNDVPTASQTDDPILDDARKGVDGWFTSEN